MTAPQMTRLPGDPSPATLRFIWKFAHFLVFITIAVNVVFGTVSYKAHSSPAKPAEVLPSEHTESPPASAHGDAPLLEEEGEAVSSTIPPPKALSFWDKVRKGPYEYSWQIMLAHFVGGRAASVGIGLKMGFGKKYLFFMNVMLDLILVLYLYPLFVTGYRHLNRVPFLGNALDSANELAYKYKDRIAPYGAFGIMLFVLFPLWSTGPLVGALLGYIIGLRTWITLLSTQIGNWLAIAIWIWFYNWLNGFSGQLAFMLLILIFVMAFIGFIYDRSRKKNKRKAVSETEEPVETVREVAGMLEPVPLRKELPMVSEGVPASPAFTIVETTEAAAEEPPSVSDAPSVSVTFVIEAVAADVVSDEASPVDAVEPAGTCVEAVRGEQDDDVMEASPWVEGEPPPDPDGEGDFFAEKPR